MGGWSILDYGINFAEKPYDWLQLGYASYLSSWALMNTGTPESNYGFWFPGKKNDGAMGWAFMESKTARAWIRKDVDRGAWFYDGEADLGNGAAIRMAATVVTEDPLFGWMAYGGILNQNKNGFTVIPRDGLRDRLSLVSKEVRTTLSFYRDGFAKEKQIRISPDLKRVSFTLENRTGNTHTTKMSIFVSSGYTPAVLVDGKKVTVVKSGEREFVTNFDVTRSTHQIEVY
jgi:hypothetical protein